jgi:hypothetical protein
MTGMPLIGAIAAAGGFVLVAAEVGPMILGAILGAPPGGGCSTSLGSERAGMSRSQSLTPLSGRGAAAG